METMTFVEDFIFLTLSGKEQLAICSEKAKEADKLGNESEALNWFIKGLNIVREQSNKEKIREFTDSIITMI